MKLIQHIKASNLLSFGPDGLDLSLGSLNVLVGPNGSGKSNFLELIEFLRAIPSDDIQGPIRRGGGIAEWIWKGSDHHSRIFIEVSSLQPHKKHLLQHRLEIANSKDKFYIKDERVVDEGAVGDKKGVYFYYQFGTGNPILNVKDHRGQSVSRPIEIIPNASILSQRQDPETYPELSHFALTYKDIKIYREWSFGKTSPLRFPQPTDQRNDRLEENFSNLGLFLSRLRKEPSTKRALIVALNDLYQGLTDFEVIVEGGTVQVFFTEGDFSIPTTRLSDGSLRYLCLLAMLLDPTPPPLICIEEPEWGMHPDILPKIADLLLSASERTQLIVTTHSDILIDALSDRPECVLVCEKHEGQTSIKRLDAENLKPWLEQYRLGQLWNMGEIGGNRW